MNQRALFVVLLRVIAVYYLFLFSSAYIGGGSLYALISVFKSGHSSAMLGTLGVAILAGVVYLVFTFALILFANKIAQFLFKEDHTVISSGSIEVAALLHVGLLTIAAYSIYTTVPGYIGIVMAWMKEQGAPVGSVESVYNIPMLEGTIRMGLLLILILKARSISNWMTKLSK